MCREVRGGARRGAWRCMRYVEGCRGVHRGVRRCVGF